MLNVARMSVNVVTPPDVVPIAFTQAMTFADSFMRAIDHAHSLSPWQTTYPLDRLRTSMRSRRVGDLDAFHRGGWSGSHHVSEKV